MSIMRESFFECSCAFDGDCRTAQVRAWTGSGARRTFLALLAAEGIRDPAQITVTPVRHDEPIASPPLALARRGA